MLSLALATNLNTCVLVARHLRCAGKKGVCIYTVRILLMCPAYSTTAFLALIGRFVALNVGLELCRKFYECIVIFAFTELLVAQLGGFEQLGHHLTDDDCVHLPPVRWVFDKYSWTPGTRFVRRSLSSVLQYAGVTLFVVPVALLSALISPTVFEVFNFLCTGCVGASQILAMYGLVVFYHANHVALAPIRPVQKLISIKLLVMASIWQGLIIRRLAKPPFSLFDSFAAHSKSHWSAEQIAEGTINGMLVVEMFILSTYHHCVYPPGEDLSRLAPSPALPSALRSAEEVAGAVLAPAHAVAARAQPNTASVGSELAELSQGSSYKTTRSADGAVVSYSEAGSYQAAAPPAAGAGAAPAEADVVDEAGGMMALRRRLWVGPGSAHWGSHVDGEQTQITGCCHATCPMTRRFYHVFDITDICKFYRGLTEYHRTASTDNLDASRSAGGALRYAMGFFRPRHSLRRAEGMGAPSNAGSAPLRDQLASGLTQDLDRPRASS